MELKRLKTIGENPFNPCHPRSIASYSAFLGFSFNIPITIRYCATR